MILVDTSVWSLALRRNRRDLNPSERHITFALRELIVRGEAGLIGPIIQETLSGIISPTIFKHIRDYLLLMDELPADHETFIRAAEFYNSCRSAGVAPGTVDMTICAAAHIHGVEILTIDPDFSRYAQHLPISLFRV